MLHRAISAIILGVLVVAAPVRAADLRAQLFPLTGEVRLLNPSASPVPFVFYSIESPSGSLTSSSGIWKSITETYDQPAGATPGNGLIDPNGDWVQLSSVATELAEGALDADGGSLPAFRAISLGKIWDPMWVPFPDLDFEIRDDSGILPITIELALDGDYSADYVVDQADYITWRKYVNSMTAFFADGDLDGIVDIDDKLIWQQNFGLTLPLPPYGLGSGGGLPSSGVPEPSSAVFALLFAAALGLAAQRPMRTQNDIALSSRV